MSFLLDVILLLIATLTIVFAVKNGFVKTVLSALSFLIALIVALVLRAPVVALLEQTPVSEKVSEGVETVLHDLAEGSSASLSSLIEDSGSSLHSLLDTVGVEHDDLNEWLADKQNKTDDALLEPLTERLAPKLTHALLNVIVFPLLFLLSLIALKLLSAVLTGLTDRIGALRFANKTLGLIIGILLALFRMVLFCVVVQMLLNVLNATGQTIPGDICREDTVLFKLLTSVILPESML
ncbi:MAG: CvpA family protein [Clostridiales bacterium]|nr:CvpA family protein [Candidatus Coliplasma caballi]